MLAILGSLKLQFRGPHQAILSIPLLSADYPSSFRVYERVPLLGKVYPPRLIGRVRPVRSNSIFSSSSQRCSPGSRNWIRRIGFRNCTCDWLSLCCDVAFSFLSPRFDVPALLYPPCISWHFGIFCVGLVDLATWFWCHFCILRVRSFCMVGPVLFLLGGHFPI